MKDCNDKLNITGFYIVPIKKMKIKYSLNGANIDIKCDKPTKEEVFQIIEKLLTIETVD